MILDHRETRHTRASELKQEGEEDGRESARERKNQETTEKHDIPPFFLININNHNDNNNNI